MRLPRKLANVIGLISPLFGRGQDPTVDKPKNYVRPVTEEDIDQLVQVREQAYSQAYMGEGSGHRNAANAWGPLFRYVHEQNLGRNGLIAASFVASELHQVLLKPSESVLGIDDSSSILGQGLSYAFRDVVTSSGNGYRFKVFHSSEKGLSIGIDFYRVANPQEPEEDQREALLTGLRINRLGPKRVEIKRVVMDGGALAYEEGFQARGFNIKDDDSALYDFAIRALNEKIREQVPPSVLRLQQNAFQDLVEERMSQSDRYTKFIPSGM